MSIVVEREALLEAIRIVAPMVPSRTTKPILFNVRLEWKDDTFTLEASNGESSAWASGKLKAEAYSGGAMLLPELRLKSILHELDKGAEVSIAASGTEAVIRSGKKNHFRVPTSDPDAWIQHRGQATALEVRIPAPALIEALESTVFATDADVHRYALGGVLLDIGEKIGEEWFFNKAYAVGADGRRMSVVELPVALADDSESRSDANGESALPAGREPIIPADFVRCICSAFRGEVGDVTLGVTESEVHVSTATRRLSLRRLEGRFPKWKEIFPKGVELRGTASAASLLKTCRRAAVMATNEARGIDVEVLADGAIRMAAMTAEHGASAVEGEFSTVEPMPVQRYDNRYLCEWLSQIGDGEVRWSVGAADSALLLEVEHRRYVLMPLARDEEPTAVAGASGVPTVAEPVGAT